LRQPTARSASQLSSVSPDRADRTVAYLAARAWRTTVRAVSSVPIWLGLTSTAFADAVPDASSEAVGVGDEQVVAEQLVVPADDCVAVCHPCQSSSASASSSDTIG
jgi:hypothetical protein